MTHTYNITGMTCGGCSKGKETAINVELRCGSKRAVCSATMSFKGSAAGIVLLNRN